MTIYFPTCSQAIFLSLPDNFIKEEAFSENAKKIAIFVSKYKQGDFFSKYCIQHCIICRPLRFHCVGGCWNRTQDSCADFGIGI
jgi:hypothetical protein